MPEKVEHDCPAAKKIDHAGYGPAILAVMWFASARVGSGPLRWWVGNDEYATAVRFCPFCGLDLYTLARPDDETAPYLRTEKIADA